MSYESASDRLSLLQNLGEQVSVGGSPVYGILENQFVPIDFGGQEIESNYPVLTIRTSDASGVSHGTAVVANGVNYTVRSIQPDGTGMTELVLEETA